MLVSWQALYCVDEKMEAWVGPRLLDLLVGLTAETRTSLLKTGGSGKQNLYISPHPTSSITIPLLEQGRPWLLPVGTCRDGKEREKGKA